MKKRLSILILATAGLLLPGPRPAGPPVAPVAVSGPSLKAAGNPPATVIPGPGRSPAVRRMAPAPSPAAPHVAGDYIITVAASTPPDRLDAILEQLGLRRVREYSAGKGGRRLLVRTRHPRTEIKGRHFSMFPEITSVSPNYIMELFSTGGPVFPNDPYFPKQWALHSDTDSAFTDDVDIDGPEAWGVAPSGEPVVVAIIDTGVDEHHDDLTAALWTNPLEAPGDANGDGFPGIKGVDDDGDGLIDEDSLGQEPSWDAAGHQTNPLYLNDLWADDDENGYNDDFHGADTGDHDGDPMDIKGLSDAAGHGTHVAGIIAAAHNDIGTAGIAPNVRIMVLKGFSRDGILTSDNELQALDYIRAMKARGVNIVAVNASYGCQDCANPSQRGAIADTTAMGILFVAAAGNTGTDNDISPVYPASYDLDRIISVTDTTKVDTLDSFAAYGAVSVDLGAPGQAIISTTLTTADNHAALAYRSGTSMAAAQVSGAIAWLASVYPAAGPDRIKERLLAGVDPVDDLAGRTVTGGRLNLDHALRLALGCPGDSRGDGDVDGSDLAAFIHFPTAFGLDDLVAGYGTTCQ